MIGTDYTLEHLSNIETLKKLADSAVPFSPDDDIVSTLDGDPLSAEDRARMNATIAISALRQEGIDYIPKSLKEE